MFDEPSTSFDFSNMIANLSGAVTSIQHLVVLISFLTGVALVFRGLAMYRAFGQAITQMSRSGEVAGPMVFIAVGAMLIYLPSTLDYSLTTLYGDTIDIDALSTAGQLIGYESASSFGRWAELSKVIVGYMKLIGLIAFVRGWVILSKMGHAGSQPGSVGKGITHIVGGVLLVNVVDTINILAATFGFG